MANTYDSIIQENNVLKIIQPKMLKNNLRKNTIIKCKISHIKTHKDPPKKIRTNNNHALRKVENGRCDHNLEGKIKVKKGKYTRYNADYINKHKQVKVELDYEGEEETNQISKKQLHRKSNNKSSKFNRIGHI
jgi:very-short-patch-repair endonuclease